MPIYEYVCENCNSHLEVIQKVSDAPLKRCPECKKNKLHKIISQSSFAFKGSGWYVSDYARKSSAGKGKSETKDAAAGSESSPSTGDAAETKTEPKPEPKTTEKDTSTASKENAA